MGGSTISTSETRIEALKLQSSAYGITIAVVGGVNRIAGNLIDYVDFVATPHTTTQSQGGKGGGVKTQNTTYSYSASVLMGICQGPIGGVSRIWKGKDVYSGGWSPSLISAATETYTPPGSGAMTYTLVHGATSIGAPTVVWAGARWSVPLAQGTDYSLTGSVITILKDVWRGQTLSINYQWGSGAPDITPLTTLGLSLASGDMSQSAPAWMTSAHPTRALADPGLAYVHGQNYDLGTGAQVDNHSFEVQGSGAYRYGAAQPDCNPAEFTADLLINGRYGARMPGGTLEVQTWIDYCAAAGLLMSPALTEQQRAADYIDTICQLTNSAPVWSVDRLRIVPYGDTSLTANGVSYVPNVTPLFDITDDWWLQDGVEDPLDWEVKQPSDRYNHVRVEYCDRSNYYNKTIAEAKDDPDIAQFGLRTMSTISAPWICDGAVARLVAQMVLQRSLNITGTGRMKLPWAYDGLEPMDLLTITDAGLGFDHLPVRITSVGEDEDGTLEIEVEDWPLGSAAATRYTSQVAGGYLHDYRVAPGNVDAPVFFEAPVELATDTGLEVYAAVRGSGSAWGGCNVWVSLDGTNYRRAGTVYGPSRVGAVNGSVSAGASTLPVDGLGAQQLISGSGADAAALATLCYVGGTNPEYLAYTTATLTGAGAYTLGGLVHGAYGTAIGAHADNDPFVRVDNAIAKSGGLTLDYIGRTIWFKFTSFNIYQQAEQELSAVTAYTYAVTGYMVSLPPGDVTGFGITQNTFGLVAAWNSAGGDIAAYELRKGASWDAGVPLDGGTSPTQVNGTRYSLPVQPAGTLQLWIKAFDAWGASSGNATPASIVITGPVAPVLSWTTAGADEVLTWTTPASGYTLDTYEVRHGSTWAGGTNLGTIKGTVLRRRADYGGARRYWVAALDGAGNVGTPGYLDVGITAPGSVTSTRADIIDNNALLYWGAPALGTLPIDRYEVRKGASWVGGTVVGSNGNSTFAAVFETVGGSFVYWVAAIDTAGNAGTPVGIPATINQPPDYVLRASIDSTFSGTKTSMYLDGGALIGPVNTSETWATHFTGNGWTTPQNQIDAGYPIYAEPALTSGSYEEQIDYGSALPATTITCTLGSEVLAGSVSASCQISVKLNSGDGWTALATGASVLATNFRYVKVVYTFTGAGGANLIKVTSLNVRLSAKLKTDSGLGTITNATTGVVVPFNLAFIDADTPIVQPAGTTPLIPVVDFTDVPNPTDFTVYLYTTAGVKTTGSFSWTARGY